MSHPADFHDAHLRHWQDAELLFRHDRYLRRFREQAWNLFRDRGFRVGYGLGRRGGVRPIR